MSTLFQTISPVDGRVLLERHFHEEAAIEMCLARSRQAQAKWQATSLKDRQDICRDAVKYLVDRADSLGEEITWQMGRPITFSPGEISGGFQERASYMINISGESLADRTMNGVPGFKRYIKQEALGTVLILAPWNYPYLTAVNALIPALLAGNCVIIKHATQTPLCAERLVEAFLAAGLPEGIFQYLHLDHQQVAKLLRDPRIDYVCFTGSVSGGRAISKVLGERFIGSGLELGGKDPAYVRRDANLTHAVESLVDGSFFNSGQSCCGIERIYVEAAVYEEFVDEFVELTNSYILGDPTNATTTMGPLVRLSARQHVYKHLTDAVAKGAVKHIKTGNFPQDSGKTPYMAPQVLTNVTHEMAIMTEETFGPVVGIMSVSNDEEAIRLMNDSQYGLTASIWTRDLEIAKSLGNRLQTGTVFMNRCDYLDPALAWTGVKDTGRGCTLSTLGFIALTRPKSFHLKYDID